MMMPAATAPLESAPDVGHLFDAHAASLCRTVHALVGSREVAEDIVQDVFILAFRERTRLTDSPALRGWLYRAALNQVRHHWRGGKRRRDALVRFERAVAPAPPEAPDACLDRKVRAERMLSCIQALPESQREVFVLFEIEGLAGTAIAETLDIPVNTVSTRLHRARAAFREHWSGGERP